MLFQKHFNVVLASNMEIEALHTQVHVYVWMYIHSHNVIIIFGSILTTTTKHLKYVISCMFHLNIECWGFFVCLFVCFSFFAFVVVVVVSVWISTTLFLGIITRMWKEAGVGWSWRVVSVPQCFGFKYKTLFKKFKNLKIPAPLYVYIFKASN